MIGPVANSVCIVAGSILGALCGPVLSQEFRKKIMNVFSCITLGIGVTMLSKGDSLPPVVLSLLFGTALGELTRFESLVMKGAFKVAGLFKRNGKAKGGKSETLSETVFRDQFAVATVLFCVSGLGIIGSMREGLTGECSLLLIKGVLDLFTAMLISASIGSVVGVLAAVSGDKITFLAVCGKEAVKAGVKAGDIVKQVSAIAGGSGGGKPDSAMGGGKDPLMLDNALAMVDNVVSMKLGL